MEQSLGVSTDSSNTSLNLDTSVKDRNSDPSLETRLKGGVADLQLNEEKRKSAKRKEFIMAELLETERSYVKVNIKDTSSEYLLLIISKSKKTIIRSHYYEVTCIKKINTHENLLKGSISSKTLPLILSFFPSGLGVGLSQVL